MHEARSTRSTAARGDQKSPLLCGRAALKGGDLDGAAGHAFVARLITARPFLPGVEGIWVDEWRRKLQELRIRAVECMADVQLERGQTSAAIQSAELVLGLDELRESGWRILMRAHAAAGNVGTALRAFERSRLTLHEQLGTVPDRQVSTSAGNPWRFHREQCHHGSASAALRHDCVDRRRGCCGL